MTIEVKKVKNKLAANNYKMTSQREIILESMIKNSGQHLSAEEIYTDVKEKDSGIGLATVYRTLELFSDLGVIHQLNFDDNCRRYELDQGGEHHHHLVCSNCGKITEFNDEILEEFEDDIQKEHNFNVTDHRIKFYGYCEDCQ
ncbi:Fur family transcriptional regulator [Selenihalanaerobacter shriftii]|uniref:Fur family transcriptional regulator, ferric uptake regulator n=1 Tax=Selenihalanaerobacter shriftii TaxID=142842 RepID=A0A1T4P5J9_9FIRM|nr:Fur family transcriptional regulator [Selenihalanaerobacter shriftii]SJZ86607.1 Fur family transcriptional regulator, ferric uptake regulator [Selenihalanaerobacter shriftii]